MKERPSYFISPNAQVLDLARSYNDASNILEGNGGNALPILNFRMHAIELFLKSLVVKTLSVDQGGGGFLERVMRRGDHTLSTTFEKVDYRHKTKLLGGRETLERDLKDLEGLFQDSRYVYESGKSLNIGLAQRVVDYLADEIPKLVMISRMSRSK